MIISRTPFRMSFFGGGTDYPEYFRDNPGASLAVTIDKYTYVTVRWLPPFFEHKHRLVYSQIEHVNEIKRIQHPSIRECLKYLKIRDGVEIHPISDLPARTGLGSSSAFTVGLLNALYTLKAKNNSLLNVKPADILAHEAVYIEREMCMDTVGCQDQLSTAVGGLNKYTFKVDGNDNCFGIHPVRVSQERLQELDDNLLLFFTGFSRGASSIAQRQIENISSTKDTLNDMYSMVQEGVDIIHNGDINAFGSLLDEAWKLKSSLSNRISNTEIDAMYELAKKEGAIGGKLLGAGGGGFLLLYVPLEKQANVRKALKDKLEVPFNFENTGTQIIVNSEYDNGK